MLSYFNPNAASKTLYPAVVKHVLVNKGVLLWKPREKELDRVFGAGLFLDLCRSPDYGPQIGFCVDEGFRYELERSDSVWNKAIREKVVYTRKDELNALIRSRAARYYDELRRSDTDLEALLTDLHQDLANHDIEILRSIETRPEWKGHGACALFVSIVQELEMHRASGASQTLARPERWEAVQAVARHMPGIYSGLPTGVRMAEIAGRPSLEAPPTLPSPNDPEAVFELVRDLMTARYVQANHLIRGRSLRDFRELAAEAEKDLSKARLFLETFRHSGVRVPNDVYRLVAQCQKGELDSPKKIWTFVTGALGIGATAISSTPPVLLGAIVLLALQIFYADPIARTLARRRPTGAGLSRLAFQNPDWWLDRSNYEG
jgi:hypothetical protein